MASMLKAALLGASGYTGADLLRLGLRHPALEFVALSANTYAGQAVATIYPHLSGAGLPDLVTADKVDGKGLDVVFCGLPHATSQPLVADLVENNPEVRVIDMGADFRLRDPVLYATTYGVPHVAPALQKEAVYGLTEHNREAIRDARIVACPGCYPTAVLLTLLPLISGAISTEDVIIDAKTGVSGSGRGLKQESLFSEAGEAVSVYAVGKHRHAPEIEQELARAAGRQLLVNFTPHLAPMSRGEMITAHVRLAEARDAGELRAILEQSYQGEPFVHVAPEGQMPSTAQVRGSNHCVISVFDDRIPGRAILVAVIDNLVKGSAGQAIQNFNVAFGFEETTALEQLPLFP